MDRKNKKGFTLTEVMIVFVILAILIGISIPIVSRYLKNGKDEYNKNLETELLTLAKKYLSDNPKELPLLGQGKNIYLTNLVQDNAISDEYKDANGGKCLNSYVIVENDNNTNKIKYKSCLICENYQSEDCDVVLEQCHKITNDKIDYNNEITITTADGKKYNGGWTNQNVIVKAKNVTVDDRTFVKDILYNGEEYNQYTYKNTMKKTLSELTLNMEITNGCNTKTQITGKNLSEFTQVDPDCNGEDCDECFGEDCNSTSDECVGDECNQTTDECVGKDCNECHNSICIDKNYPIINHNLQKYYILEPYTDSVTVNISLKVTDQQSGIKSIEYSFDDENEVTNNFTTETKETTLNISKVFSKSGTHILKVKAVDNVGNETEIEKFKIKVVNVIRYADNGGTFTKKDINNQPIDYQIKDKGDSISLFNKEYITKTGYTLTGFKEQKTNTEYKLKSEYSYDESIILIAQWSSMNIKLKYYCSKNTQLIKEQDISSANGNNTFLAASDVTCTKTGYHIKGWATEDRFSEKLTELIYPNFTALYDAGEKIKDTFIENIYNSNNKEVNMYPVWEANTYTIKYNLDGGNWPTNLVKEENKEYNYDNEITIPNPEKENMAFTGWEIKSANSNTALVKKDNNFEKINTTNEKGSIFKNLTDENNKEITFTAQWQIDLEKVYIITYDANGGKNAPQPTVTEKTKIATITNDIPTKEGYEFVGWAKTKTATKPDYLKGATYNDRKTIVLYAVWKEKEITIIYDCNYNSQTKNQTIKYTNVKEGKAKITNICTRDYYQIANWESKDKKYNSTNEIVMSWFNGVYNQTRTDLDLAGGHSVRLKAIWQANKMVIRYSTGLIDDSLVKFDPASTTYGFKPDSTTYTYVILKDAKANIYDVDLMKYGDKRTSGLVDVGPNAGFHWSRKGYTWNKWYTMPDTKGTLIYSTPTTKSDSYCTITKNNTACYDEATEIIKLYNSGVSDDRKCNLKTGNCIIRLYAHWQPKTVTVNYHCPDGTKTQEVTYGVKNNEFNQTCTKTGYTLTGWAAKSTDTTALYSVTNSITDSWIENVYNGTTKTITSSNHSTTLYPVWRKNKLTIKYSTGVVNNDTTVKLENANYEKCNNTTYQYICNKSDKNYYQQTMEYGTTYENGLVNASTFGISRLGYSFTGWYNSNKKTLIPQTPTNNKYNKAVDIDSCINDGDCNVNLYAHWKNKAIDKIPSGKTYFCDIRGNTKTDTFGYACNNSGNYYRQGYVIYCIDKNGNVESARSLGVSGTYGSVSCAGSPYGTADGWFIIDDTGVRYNNSTSNFVNAYSGTSPKYVGVPNN